MPNPPDTDLPAAETKALPSAIVEIRSLSKRYAGGHEALKGIDLDIREGEILALLGPNGAGKTTLISIICGLVTPSSGEVRVAGHDIIRDYRQSRSLIGLVPQELALGAFDSVRHSINFSRGLHGLPRDDAWIDHLLERLTLADKANNRIQQLSGGMKRRVLIAKALAHKPRVLFLDEPTAGVDVELRKDMWALVEELRADGVTIILTTHYIEEAEAISDRVGVIRGGQLLELDDTAELMRRFGQKSLTLQLREPLSKLPDTLVREGLELIDAGRALRYSFDTRAERTGITRLLRDLADASVSFNDLHTRESSLEEIFVQLVHEGDAA